MHESRVQELVEKRIHEAFGVEGGQIIRAFAEPHELDGNTQFLLNRHHDAALRGTVELGEHSADAVRREVREELGIDCTVRKLAFVGEHLFTVHGIPNHRIEFHYLVEVEPETVPITTCEEEHRYPCVWLPLDSLADYPLKPKFLVHELPQWNGKLKHLATHE